MSNRDDWADPKDVFGNDDDDDYFRPTKRQTGPSRSNGLSPLAMAGIVIGCIFSVVAIGTVIYAVATRDSRDARPVTALRTRAQLQEEATLVFHRLPLKPGAPTESVFEDAAERQDVRRFMDRLEEFTAEEDLQGLGRLMDVGRMMSRIEQTGVMKGWSRIERIDLKAELENWEFSESQWFRIKLVDILKPKDEPNTRIVYAHGYDDVDDPTEIRLWIGRNEDGTWKLYDWERMDLGLTECRDWELYLRYRSTPSDAQHQQWINACRASDSAVTEGDLDAARLHMRTAEAARVPPERSDYCKVLNGYRWQGIGDYDKAVASFNSVRDKDEVPGAYIGLMYSHQGTDAEAALAAAENYERLLGPSIPVCQNKAQLLASLEREEEAAAEWSRIVDLEPDNVQALTEVITALPADGKSDFLTRLEAVDDPVALASQVAQRVSWRDFEALQWLSEHLTETAPESPSACATAGLVAGRKGEYAQAAELYSKAMQKEESEEARIQYMYDFLDASVSAGQMLAGYLGAVDQLEAFSHLTDAWDEYELEVGRDEFEQLLSAHREHHPQDAWLTYYAAQLAIEDGQFERAEADLRGTIMRLTADAEAADDSADDSFVPREYQRTQLSSQLTTVLFWQGRVREAFEREPDHLAQLGQLCVTSHRLDDLRQLIELSKDSHQDDREFHKLQGDLAAAKGHWDAAFGHYVLGMKLSESGQYWNGREGTATAALRSGRWRELFAGEEDDSSLFYLVSNRMIEQSRWTELEALVRIAKERELVDEFVRQQKLVEMYWQQKDYEACADATQKAIEAAPEDVSPWQIENLWQERIASLIRLGEFEKAAAQAATRAKESKTPELQAIVAAAAGELDAALAFALNDSIDTDNLYADADTGEMFLSEHFRPLHDKSPVSSWGAVGLTAQFVLSSPMTLDEQSIHAALQNTTTAPGELSPSFNVQQYEHPDGGPPIFTIQMDRGAVWCRARPVNYSEVWQLRYLPPDVAEAVSGSNSALTIGVSGLTPQSRDLCQSVARQLGTRLAGENATVVRIPHHSSWWLTHLYKVEDPALAHWATTGETSKLSDSAPQVIETNKRESMAHLRQFRHELHNVIRSSDEESESAPLEICIQIGGILAAERLWVTVQDHERSYATFTFQGTLNDKSQLVPALEPGLPVSVMLGEIVGWKIGDDAPVLQPWSGD